MMSLDEIAIKHGTDKATRHPAIAGHGYAPHYEFLFSAIRDKPIKLLEIGVGGGESIRTWLEYFSAARVFGVDVVAGTNEFNTVGSSPDSRYVFVNGDQSSGIFWQCFIADYGTGWDVVIDDGGHCNDQIIVAFSGLWNHVSPGGIYCVEDLNTSYGSGVFVKPGWENHLTYLKNKIDEMNIGDSSIAWMRFSKELAVLVKK